MTPCPMCGHDVAGVDERGVLINAIARSGARLVDLRKAHHSAKTSSEAASLSAQIADEVDVRAALQAKLEVSR